MTDEQKQAAAERVEQAHIALAADRRDEAREIVDHLLGEYPHHPEAIALRDRIDTEENRDRLAKETEADREEGDESPLVAWMMLGLGIACTVGGVILTVRFLMLGSRVGFDTEVKGTTVINPGPGKFPVHNFFLYPIAMFVIAAISLYGYRRYMRNR